jgi:hypothetical protein
VVRVIDRFTELKDLLIDPLPRERRLRATAGVCAAMAAWLALALREPLLLVEIPLLVFLYAKLVSMRRREAPDGDDDVEDWHF